MLNTNFFVYPLAETNEQFYNQIYTGQRISVRRKPHKDYPGKLWMSCVSHIFINFVFKL